MLIRWPFLLALLVVGWCPRSYADDRPPLPEWRDDTDTCRAMTEALLNHRITDATDAVIPANATDRLRRNVRALMRRLSDGLAEASGGKPAEMQRIMPDATLDGFPVAIESWSFGDQLYLVGCMIRPAGESAHISIQAYPTMKDLLDHLHETDGETIQ